MRLTPCGGADRIDGVAIDAEGERYLKARVRAAPEDGKANAALEALVARVLRVAKGQVSVIRGSTSRMKTLGIEGVSEAEIAAFVSSLKDGA